MDTQEYPWGHNSSVDSSAPAILRSRGRIPSSPSMLISFTCSQVLCCICDCFVKRTKINQNRPDLAHFFKKEYPLKHLTHIQYVYEYAPFAGNESPSKPKNSVDAFEPGNSLRNVMKLNELAKMTLVND